MRNLGRILRRRPQARDGAGAVIAFVGKTESRDFVAELRKRSIGRVIQRGDVPARLYAGERWLYDNLAYSDWLQNRPWDGAQFRSDVAKIMASEHRPFACVCPDRVASPDSLSFSLAWRDELPDELPWYLALQDGMDPREIGTLLLNRRFSGLFIGGSNAFKLQAATWVRVAHSAGIPCHFGRASTPAKMRAAWDVGCDSFDTSFPLWTRPRFWQFLRTVDAHYETAQENMDFKESAS